MTTAEAKTTEQQAPTSPPEKTDAAQADVEPGVEPSVEPTVAELQTKIAEAQERTNSLETERDAALRSRDADRSRLRKENDRDQKMDRFGANLQLLTEHLSDPDSDPTVLRQRLSEVQATQGIAEASAMYAASIADRLEAQGMSYEDDPTLVAIAREWGQMLGRENPRERDLINHYQQSMARIDVMTRETASKAVTAAEKRGEEKGLATADARLNEAGVKDLSTGRASGGAASKTFEALAKVDTRKMTHGERIKHGKDLDAAMRAAP